ncbi:NAD(P)H-dependent oxidoreductase [Clostridium pasteurianum]|uniref:Putative NADPH-quinone reductase (Modulator of drug activity B) n=1 Tax=Clostridium pasteurianum BC1 TaxID=86416 RepID=R4KG48_CLOPA|nr:NAD(P)H-dependent oxidoreductase [Clostridium pasteurianum]AGK98580.1 putative NADPH-quinone reductase (modulator of drug activity B) [Clostridium pasteurianum BC1]
MKTLVIVAHPNMEESRINKRFMEEIKKQPKVTVHELYKEYEDEKIDVEREQQLLLDNDRIVLQFPFYWYSTPSLIKKWQDTVLTYGWAYGPNGNKLNGKEFVLAVSTGGPQNSYLAGGYNNYTLSELLRPLQATSNLIGTTYLTPYVFYGAVVASDDEIEKGAKAYVAHVLNPELDPKAALRNLTKK